MPVISHKYSFQMAYSKVSLRKHCVSSKSLIKKHVDEVNLS